MNRKKVGVPGRALFMGFSTPCGRPGMLPPDVVNELTMRSGNWRGKFHESRLLAEGVREGEAADLELRMVGGGPEAEGFYAGSGGQRLGDGGAVGSSCGRVVKVNGKAGVAALPTEDVGAGGKGYVGDGDGGLDEEVVRVFSVGGVSGGDEDDSGDEFAVVVDDAGGGAHLCLDALFFDGGAGGQGGFELGGSGGAPGGF